MVIDLIQRHSYLVIYPLYHLEEVPKEATSLADIAGYSIIKIVAQPNLR